MPRTRTDARHGRHTPVAEGARDHCPHWGGGSRGAVSRPVHTSPRLLWPARLRFRRVRYLLVVGRPKTMYHRYLRACAGALYGAH